MKWFFAKKIIGSQNTDSGTCFVYDGIEKMGTIWGKSLLSVPLSDVSDLEREHIKDLGFFGAVFHIRVIHGFVYGI